MIIKSIIRRRPLVNESKAFTHSYFLDDPTESQWSSILNNQLYQSPESYFLYTISSALCTEYIGGDLSVKNMFDGRNTKFSRSQHKIIFCLLQIYAESIQLL